MKRVLSLILLLSMLLSLASCAPALVRPIEQEDAATTAEAIADQIISATNGETEEETESETSEGGMIPQSAYEKKIMKFLILGNSHSNDVFFQLARVFKAQGYDMPYVIGFLYYSGCKLSQHVGFLNTNQAVYDYYKTSDVSYIKEEECTMKKALMDEAWDVIILHPGGADDMKDEDLQLSFRRRIEDYVNQHVKTEHVFAWHQSWANPDEEAFWENTWWRKPPSGYKQNLIENYGFDPVNQLTITTNAVKTHILTDPTYQITICTGTAIMYANRVLGVSQFDLYRDYTHLTDLGRVIAAYSFYAQFTGKPIEEVLLDKVPAKSRQAHYTSLGDLVLTDELKEIIKASANYSFESPWEVPGV